MYSEGDSGKGRKGIYFLPSLFTTAGLLFGFIAIIQATHGRFDLAAIWIFVAMIMDGLDGRVARWTNTTSEFGKEYDSLVDLVAFGVAPAMMVYFWSLQSISRAGAAISFLYVAATALRLARFNTLTIKDKRYFYGLPSPSGAAFVVFWVWCMYEFGISGEGVSWLSAGVTLVASILMVSNLRFRSFKDFDYKDRIPFVVLIVLLLMLVLIYFDPSTVLFAMALGYVLSGPWGWLMRWRKGHQESPAFLPDDDEGGDEGTDSPDDPESGQ